MENVDRVAGKKLVYKVTCPNCWHKFFPEDVLFIAKHPDLLVDPVVGEQGLRFIPSRFNVAAEAIDPKGFPTADMACPRCHLAISPMLLEIPPLFISLVGSPASGKSYFLTTMAWELRRLLPKALLSFSDADPIANSAIHDYEKTLFLNPHPESPTEIRKTQADDPHLYRMSRIGDAVIRFPVPLQFALWPDSQHPMYNQASNIGRIIVLYDNAGEDFLPGAEDRNSAAVQHLAQSQILLVMFDPTQDARVRQLCRQDDPQLTHGARPDAAVQVMRQETLLRETAVRIRRIMGIAQDKRINKPLIVVLPKFDVWSDLAEIPFQEEPYVEGDQEDLRLQLNIDVVEEVSERLRQVLRELCPEFVATAEGLSSLVRYIPVSSLGRSPEYIQQSQHNFYGIRPGDIKPRWVTVPLTYCLCKWARDLVPAIRQA